MIPILAAFASCQLDVSEQPAQRTDALTIRLEVEDIATGVQASTKGTIPAENGETTINSLYLLFFDYAADGSGRFVKSVSGSDLGRPLAMNASYTIPFAAHTELSADNSYVILALANVPKHGTMNGFLDGTLIDEFLERFTGMTEKQAIEQTTIAVSGVDTDQDDDSKAVSASHLVMSARVVRQKTDNSVVVKLNRGVARFDVYNDPSTTGYKLVSASVWGAASETPVWYDRMTQTPDRIKRFYGLKSSNNDFTGDNIIGGLYGFENFVSNPGLSDAVTTCLILGLQPSGGGTTTYYRVNIHPSESSQNLIRNNVYKIRINSVSGPGEDNEYSAWSQARTQLSVSVNEWNLDDNGMVLTDGTNTMVIPVKLVRLDPAGDVRDFTIFTIGSETLHISKNALPYNAATQKGIKAELVGSLLRVTASPLDSGEEELRGSIEIAFGSLRGTISFIQSPMENLYLDLNRYEVPNYAAIGRNGTSDNTPFNVTASGSWTATIYNMSEDESDPGFSFNPSGAPVTVLKSAQNPFANMFQVYTTGDNPSNSEERHGFVMITLDEDPENFNRVVVLTQDPKTEFVISPSLPASLRFSATGLPGGVSGGTASKGFEFSIDPGMSGGAPVAWSVAMSPTGDGDYFEVVKTAAGSVNQFVVRAKGTTETERYPENAKKHLNLGDRALSASLLITVGGTTISVPVTQDKMDISVSTQGTQVPKAGGMIPEVTVNIDPSLNWSAAIVSNFTSQKHPAIGHAGYLAFGGSKVAGGITNKPQSAKLSAGFDKLYYPMTEETPAITIRVSLVENPNVYTEFTVTQEPLNPLPMNILDVRNTSYGCLTGSSHYLEYYRSYLKSAAMYGTAGSYVKTGTPVNITGIASGAANDPTEIASSYAYLHVGGQPGDDYSQARHTAVNDWWQKYKGERVVLYNVDNRNDRLFAGSTDRNKKTTVLSILRYTYLGTSGTPFMNPSGTTQATPVFKYLVKDGPFRKMDGTVRQNLDYSTFSFARDATSAGVNPGSLPVGAVPVIVDNAGAALLVIDPVNNVVFIGESQMFHSGYSTAAVTAAGNGTDKSKFLGNLLAYIINAAQYGTHFTDLFLPGNSTLYNDAFGE